MKNTSNEINKALQTKDVEEQKRYLFSYQSIVRKALACNENITTEIANHLAFDKTLNVSFVALQNKHCTVKRDLPEKEIQHRCIVCKEDITNPAKCLTC